MIVHKDVDVISDFNSVNEESEDDNPESFVHTQQEYTVHVYKTIEYDLIF